MNNHHEFFIKIMVDGINKRFPENKFYWRSDLEEHDNVPRVPISDPRKEGAWLIRTPDLIAEDMSGDSKIHILGEAKTYNYFSADHKRRDEQLDYYINSLLSLLSILDKAVAPFTTTFTIDTWELYTIWN